MTTKGFDNFDVLYFINLEHRKDRLEHITKELSKTNIDKSKINRIEAIYNKNLGILGCAKSHILALETFISTPDNIKNCIIFEDDFEFTESQSVVNHLINQFFNNVKDYDVLMLASNTKAEVECSVSTITKIMDAQTLSAYSVNKKFAKTLLENFKESVGILKFVGYKIEHICFDMYMKRLQPKSNWFCLKPKVGKQMESYSDIEYKVVDYKC